ncbi:MAG TPA: thiamine-phosphate kinase [Vicinamibacterales bacterium]|nr:thiamine-phosphate kinase [Vicinamibacterales bacterium]
MKRVRSSTPADLPGERALIEEIRARAGAAPAWLPVGIGDDAAVVEGARGALEILTTDAIVEGIHFDRRVSTLADVGWKALAVNLSDIAAMGGTPRLALLSLGLPEAMSAAEVRELLDGFFALAGETRVTLAGGNITRSPGPLFVDVTVSGFARRRQVLTRGGARAGDALYVTGQVGAAAAGLGWSTGRPAEEPIDGIDACVERHRRPDPRVRVGALLGRNRAASACMDLSDGLADAVRQVAAASGLGAVVDGEALPIPDAARTWFQRRGVDPASAAAAGGDDYELLFAVPRRARGRLATVIRQARGVPITRVGELTADPRLILMNRGRPEQLPDGFVHF